jgi:hypothetical protein
LTTIRTQLNLLTAVVIGGSGFSGYKAYETRREVDAYDRAMNESMETRSVLLLMEDLPYHDDTFRRLQLERDRLGEEDRRKAFGAAVTTYATKNRTELRRSIRRALKVEAGHYDRNRGRRGEIEARFEKLMMLSTGILGLGLFLIVLTIHARIFNRDNQWQIEDLGSTNGTWLNRHKVAGPMVIKPGDVVQIGNTVMEMQ